MCFVGKRKEEKRKEERKKEGKKGNGRAKEECHPPPVLGRKGTTNNTPKMHRATAKQHTWTNRPIHIAACAQLEQSYGCPWTPCTIGAAVVISLCSSASTNLLRSIDTSNRFDFLGREHYAHPPTPTSNYGFPLARAPKGWCSNTSS